MKRCVCGVYAARTVSAKEQYQPSRAHKRNTKTTRMNLKKEKLRPVDRIKLIKK